MDNKNWVYSEGSKLYWTSDGGNTFEEVHDFEDPNLYSHFINDIEKIFFADGLCCIDSYLGIRISSDNCRTFNILTNENNVFQEILSPDGNDFLRGY